MIIFASDFDNTLFYHQGENGYIRKEDIEKIEQFQAVGNLFGLCTGRALFDVFLMQKILSILTFIFLCQVH